MAGLVLKEFGDITNLLKTVPHREQRGLFSSDICWTCIDFTTDWVAVGTDTGWLYLYDRFEETVKHKLTTQQRDRNPVTKVKLKRSVDYVVAMGTASGFISIFQLPVLLFGLNAKLQAFAIRGLHHSPVTCFEWSQNAMKLFSGDEDGVIVCTEIDYTMNQSQSYVVCKEPHSVVQLSYAHKTLLISTRWRAVLCSADDSMNVTQVGRKDRKTLGPFGATFFPGSFQPQEAVLYCARPNLSLWKANIRGTVELTVIFKDLAANLDAPVGMSLLPDQETKDPLQSSPASPHFSQLFVFGCELLLSYFENGLFVLNPRSGQFVCYHAALPDIADIAVNDEEVFLLMKSNHGTPRYLASKPFRTKLPSSLFGGIPRQDSGKEMPSQIDAPVKVSEAAAPTDRTTTNSMSKSIFGVLKEISKVIPPIQDGTTSEEPDLQVVTPEAGEEVRDGSDSEADETSARNAMASIPIVQLDPTEIAPLVVKPQTPGIDLSSTNMEEMKASVMPASEGEQQDLPRCLPAAAAADEIVFASVRKKIKKKKAKSQSSRPPDVLSISSGELGQRDRSMSPADFHRRSASQQRSVDQADFQERSASPSLQPPSMSQKRSLSPAGSQQRSASPFVKEAFASPPRSISPLPLFLHPSFTEPVDFLLPLTKHQNRSFQDPVPLVRQEAETSQVVQAPVGVLAAPVVSALSNAERDLAEPSVRVPTPVLPTVDDVTPHPDVELIMKACAREQSADVISTVLNEHNSTATSTQTICNFRDSTTSSSQVEAPKTGSPVEPPATGCQAEQLKLGYQTELWKTGDQIMHEETRSLAELKKTTDQTAENQKNIQKAENQAGLIFTSSNAPNSSFATDYLTSPSSTFRSIYHRNNYDEDSPEQLPQQPDPAPPPMSPDVCTQPKTVETWLEFYLPGPVKSLCLSSKYAWCVDRLDHVHYTALSQPLKWVKVDQPGQQVSVSPNGSIIWLLCKNSAYSANKITSRAPAGSEWREVAREVSSVSVDDHVAWYSKLNGEVMVQKGLTKERTSFRSLKVASDYHVVEVVCGRGIVWAVTDDRIILVRVGIAKDKEEGTSWMPLQGQGNRLMPFSLSVCCQGVVWMVDLSGRAWYTTDVTPSSPHGSGFWWEISATDSSASDVPTPSARRSLWELSQSLTWSSSWVENGGSVAANKNGEVWICFGKGQSVYVSSGSITGHRWELATPSGMLPTTKWRRISCCQGDGESTVVWLEQSNGDIFCIITSAAETHVQEISPPLFGETVASLAATAHALWCLMSSGKMYVRRGMSSHCFQGVKWTSVDLSQLGNVKITHISVSQHNVWAVDNVGSVYMRIGVKPPSNAHINPAWVEVDLKNLPTGVQLTQVVTSPNSAMVWAIDNKRNVYIRAGVTESLPLGTNWISISGGTPECIQVSNHNAYTVNNKGDVFMRSGLSRTNPSGDSWKKIPGKCSQLAVSSVDDLWALDKDGQLYRRHTHDLEFSNNLLVAQARLSKKDSVDADWEIL